MSRMLVRSAHRVRTSADDSAEAASHAALPISIAKPSMAAPGVDCELASCRRQLSSRFENSRQFKSSTSQLPPEVKIEAAPRNAENLSDPLPQNFRGLA